MNTDAKILIKYPQAKSSKNQKHPHDQVDLISGMQVWFSLQKSINAIHNMEKLNEKND